MKYFINIVLFIVMFMLGFFYKSYLIKQQSNDTLPIVVENTKPISPLEVLIDNHIIEKIVVPKSINIKEESKKIEITKFEQFKILINSSRYSEAMDIYGEFINSESVKKYQYYLFETIELLITERDNDAKYLVELFLDLEYDNSYGVYFLSQIEIQNKNYQNALTLLYELKNNYLEESLDKRVIQDIMIIEPLLKDQNEKIKLSKIYNKKIQLKRYGTNFIIQGILNGNKRVNLLLDTGASISSINYTIAKGLIYKVLDDNIKLNTAAGAIKVKLIEINSLIIDDIKINDFKLTVSKVELIEGIDGLLGMNFLNKFKFYIDQENAILYLN